MAKNSHLTLNERITIRIGLDHGLSRAAIAKPLGKDRSTIAKEIKKHRYTVFPKVRNFNGKRPVFDCSHMDSCHMKNVCRDPCERYEIQTCVRRDKKVGVCNGCEQEKKCKCVQYHYDPTKAFDDYKDELSDSRQGVNLTTSQAKKIGDIVKPLIDQGQSLYAIVHNHPELKISEKTLYNYITMGVFTQNGLIDLDLRLKTSRKQLKTKIYSRPRESRAYLKGRTYDCYQQYMAQHPNTSVVEMDTVYNDVSNGPFIQTFEFVEYDLMVAFYHKEKTAAAMSDGVRKLKKRLGPYFESMVGLLITDRGMEFSDVDGIEGLGCRLFFCDPMCSCQKPNVENNHLMLRWILPKKKNLEEIGFKTQEDLDLIFSHINSYPREALKGKSAIDLLLFYQDDKVLQRLHLKKIEVDKIVLTPMLIKKQEQKTEELSLSPNEKSMSSVLLSMKTD